jgi:hypothetical protein
MIFKTALLQQQQLLMILAHDEFMTNTVPEIRSRYSQQLFCLLLPVQARITRTQLQSHI